MEENKTEQNTPAEKKPASTNESAVTTNSGSSTSTNTNSGSTNTGNTTGGYSSGGNTRYEKKPYNREGSGGDRSFKKSRFSSFKKKKCRFCGKDNKAVEKELNYKNIDLLSKFVSDRGKLFPARITGNCARHQRRVKVEVKKARYMAFLPFAKIDKINK